MSGSGFLFCTGYHFLVNKKVPYRRRWLRAHPDPVLDSVGFKTYLLGLDHGIIRPEVFKIVAPGVPTLVHDNKPVTGLMLFPGTG